MSFILDALRKSERERQRNQSPGVAASRFRQRPARAIWLPLVIALVVINIGLLVFLALRDTDAPATSDQPISNPATAAQQPAATAPVTRQPTATDNRRLRSELEPAPAKKPPVVATPAPAATPAPQASSGAPGQPVDEYANLPSLTELSMAGSVSLPPLRIDIHVYSQQPTERFVFINMSKYREGDQLSEGPVLRAITPNGVILSDQGRDFLVTRE